MRCGLEGEGPKPGVKREHHRSGASRQANVEWIELDANGRSSKRTPTTPRFRWYVDSPIGSLRLLSTGPAICELSIVSSRERLKPPAGLPLDRAPFATTLRELDQYFDGTRRAFQTRIVLSGTRFQLSVWRALLAIPYGTSITYADLARSVGRPAAVRAVGAANGRNPIAILVPCHRVIGSDRTLTGYSGGIDCKRALLTLEGVPMKQ